MINRHKTITWWLGYFVFNVLWMGFISTGALAHHGVIILVIGFGLGWSYVRLMNRAGFYPLPSMGKEKRLR